MWFVKPTPFVDDLKLTFRRFGSDGNALRSFIVSFVVGIGTKIDPGGLVVVLVLLVVDVTVVVVPPPGVLAGSAGSLPASSSSRSKKPSSSRSTPTRAPEPGGTHRYVRSCPPTAAWLRRSVSVTSGSPARSLWNDPLPTRRHPRAMPPSTPLTVSSHAPAAACAISRSIRGPAVPPFELVSVTCW